MSYFFTRRAVFTSISALSIAGIFYSRSTSNNLKKMLPSYEATFSVPLECDACVNDISCALSKLQGITSTTFSIPTHRITITSTTAPSAIISAIQSTGRDAILRGSGAPNSAAVCILEIPPSQPHRTSTNPSPFPSPPPEKEEKTKYDSPVRGLARLIQLSEQLTLLDLTLTSLPAGRYRVSLRRTGDISHGSSSLGAVYRGEDGRREGDLGTLEVDGAGRGSMMGEIGWSVWELVGRGMCAERVDEGDGKRQHEEVVGVVARSAGVWENEKVVCGCSGKTVWEEREEMVGKGMI